MRPDILQHFGKLPHKVRILGKVAVNFAQRDPCGGVGAGLGRARFQGIPVGIVWRNLFAYLGLAVTLAAPMGRQQGSSLGLMASV